MIVASLLMCTTNVRVWNFTEAQKVSQLLRGGAGVGARGPAGVVAARHQRHPLRLPGTEAPPGAGPPQDDNTVITRGLLMVEYEE